MTARPRPTLLVLLLASACTDAGRTAAQPGPPQIEVAPALAREVPIYHEAIGETAGWLDIQVRARVDGVIDEVHFVEGKSVEKGDLLYTIDPAPFEAEMREAAGVLAQAKAEFVRAESNLKRVRPLVEIDALSQRTLDDAIAMFDATKGLVEAAQASVDSAKIRLGYTEIKSPITGLIGKSEAYAGDYVGQPPNPVVLATVSQLDPIKVRFSISERDYLDFSRRADSTEEQAAKEKQDPHLELFLADGSVHQHGGEVILGSITFANREINRETGTLMIEATFANPRKDLGVRPGQFARVRSTVAVRRMPLVPQRAVQELQGRHHVLVVNDQNMVETRAVMPSVRVGKLWAIESGIAEGEKVVVSAMHRLRPGVPVVPVLAKETGGADGEADK